MRSTFVGRERELAELVSACESGADSDTHLFLISGEPGIGKTRLADELASRAKARGLQVLWGRCWEGDGAPAYWPWIQVIRGFHGALDLERRKLVLESEIASDIIHEVAQIVPDLRHMRSSLRPQVRENLDPSEARFRLFDAITNLLKIAARSRRMLIVLDDLHDADEASFAMLHFFVRELKGVPIVIVATYREAEVRNSSELSKLVGQLSRDGHPIPISGLSETEVKRFIRTTAGSAVDDTLVSRICAATNGNPLFVDGIVRGLIAESASGATRAPSGQFKIPVGVREAIRARLTRLSAESNALLTVAAAIGKEFEFDLCRAVVEVSAEEVYRRLDEAERAGIVTTAGQERYRFAHALIRDAAYEELDAEARTILHRVIATRLEEKYRYDLDSHAAELAHHFREANDSEKAIDYWVRAASAAYIRFSMADCEVYLRAALALTEGRHDNRRADLLVHLGRHCAFNFDLAEGITLLEEALKIYRKLNHEQKIATTNNALGLAFSLASGRKPELANFPRAIRYLRQAQEWRGEWPGRSDLANLHFALSISLFHSGQVDEAISAAKRATEEYQRHNNLGWIKTASFHARLLTQQGKHKRAAALLRDIVTAAQESRHPEQFRAAMFNIGSCWMILRDPIKARRFFTIGMERKGITAVLREIHFGPLAAAELMAGDLRRAKSIVAEHDALPSFLINITFREGNWDAAIEMLQTMLESARQVGNRFEELSSLWQLSQILRVAGDLKRAADYLAQSLRSYDPGDLLWEMRIRPEAALIAIEMGRPDEALQHLEVCRKALAQGEDWCGMISPVERAEGIVAAVQGGDFAPHFERSIAVSKQYSLRWDEADTLHDWGVALAKRGEFAEANEKFDAAIETYRRHGAGQRWTDRVEAARHRLPPAVKARESIRQDNSPRGEIA